MFGYFISVAVRAVNYASITLTCLLGSVVYLFVHFHYNGQHKRKLRETDNTEQKVKDKKSNRFVPTVTFLLPFAVPFFDGLLMVIRCRFRGIGGLHTHQDKYGKIYWLPLLHKRVLIMNDVNMIQNLLSSSEPQHLNKPEINGNIFIEFMRDGLLNSKFPVWSSRRKVLKHCFTYSCLQKYLTSINKHGQDLVKNLKNNNDNDIYEITDTNLINETVHLHLVKIIADIVMGGTSLPSDTASKFAENYRITKEAIVGSAFNPFLKIPLLRFFSSTVNNQHRSIMYMVKFFKDITIEYRKQYEQNIRIRGDSNQTTNLFVDAQMGEKPHRCLIEEMIAQGATNKEIYDEVGTFMVSGHETMHAALQMLMFHLAINPHHQFMCRKEIDLLINQKGNTEINAESNLKNLTINDLGRLKYLERCVLESFRITPTVPIVLRELGSSFKISDDLELPSRTIIGVPIWLVHRDPDNFPSPQKFDPDRFLPENVKKRHPCSFIPLSVGPRNCIGNKLALIQLKVIMFWILRNFELCSNDKLEDVKFFFEVTIKPERNFNICLKRRHL